MFKNKKSITLTEAITFALAVAIIIFGVIPFWNRAYAAFFGERDDGSLANFEGKLIPKINELLKSDKKIDYRELNYYLGSHNWYVVGFKKGSPDTIKYPTGAIQKAAISIKKPDSCGQQACLCLFKPGNSGNLEGGKPAKPCIKFDKVEYFLKEPSLANTIEKEFSGEGIYDSGIPKSFIDEQYKYFILTLNVNEFLYIEKYTKQNGEIVLYFAPVNKVANRIKYIDTINKQ